MGKTLSKFFHFVYKTILFIILIPINAIKHFCIGFFFTFFVLFELIFYAIIFMSFAVYKTAKYLLFSLAFPIMIFNVIKRRHPNKEENIEVNNDIKESKIIEDDLVVNSQPLDQNNLENAPPIDNETEQILNIPNESLDNVYLVDDVVEVPIIIPDNVGEVVSSINIPLVIDDYKKTQKKSSQSFIKRFLKFLWFIIEVICYPVYKISKYFVFGLITILIGIYKIIELPSFIVYKIFKYLLYSLTLPIMIINTINRNNISNRKINEERRLKREEEEFKKKVMKQNAQEAELREALGKSKTNIDEFTDENIKINKRSFSEKFNSFLNSMFSLPKNIVKSIKDSYHNSIFIKNAKNEKDINRQELLLSFEGKDAEKNDVKLVYEYIAKKDGKVLKDYFEAFSKVEVHSFLLSEGYEVYNIRTNKWIQFLHKGVANSKIRVKTKDLIFFLTQLSTYIKAGIPLVDSLKVLTRQFKNKNYQRMFRVIVYDLTMGDSFSTALTKQGKAFPKILINMIKASEMTGELPEVLDDMADYFSEIDATRKQMITALMYPMIIMVISIGVIIFIMLFVIPKFVSIYETMDASQIPKFTLIVLAVSNFLKNYIFIVLGAIAVFIFIMIYLFKHVKAVRSGLQWLAMHLPVFGNVVIYNEVTTFTKTFASLLSHNVFITDSMEILNRVTDNEIYKMLILDTITNLAKGEKISAAFKDHWAFPIPAYEMLVTGEKTGQLPEMMSKVSEYYQELHRNQVARIKTFIEPILIIFLTVVVGAIVLAIVIPMFNMYQAVQSYS